MKKLLFFFLLLIFIQIPLFSEETDNVEKKDNITAIERSEDEIRRNSLAMLNYLTVQTFQVTEAKNSRLVLDDLYNKLLNNFDPNAIDERTQEELNSLLNSIYNFKSISTKRDRAQFLFEREKASILRKASPNPLSILSVVTSGISSRNILGTIASLAYLGFDTYNNYQEAKSSANLNFIKEGWELDDQEAEQLHQLSLDSFNYMLDLVRNYKLKGTLALNKKQVEDYAKWKYSNSSLISKISWFERNYNTYLGYNYYYLDLAYLYSEYAKTYNSLDYDLKVVDCIKKYQENSYYLFRKDYDYAKALVLVINSCINLYESDTSKLEYLSDAYSFLLDLYKNKNDEDTSVNYFMSSIWTYLYSQFGEQDKYDKYCELMLEVYKKHYSKSYSEEEIKEFLLRDAESMKDRKTWFLGSAQDLLYENLTILIDQQLRYNEDYLKPVQYEEIPLDATEQQKKEIQERNNKAYQLKNEFPMTNDDIITNVDSYRTVCELRGFSKEQIDAWIWGLIPLDRWLFLFIPKQLKDLGLYDYEKSIKGLSSQFNHWTNPSFEILVAGEYIDENSRITAKIFENGKVVQYCNDFVFNGIYRQDNWFYIRYWSNALAYYPYDSFKSYRIELTAVNPEPTYNLYFFRNYEPIYKTEGLWIWKKDVPIGIKLI